MPYLKCFARQDISALTRVRRFETKIGERLQVVSDPANLERSLDEFEGKICDRGHTRRHWCKGELWSGWYQHGLECIFGGICKCAEQRFFRRQRYIGAGLF